MSVRWRNSALFTLSAQSSWGIDSSRTAMSARVKSKENFDPQIGHKFSLFLDLFDDAIFVEGSAIQYWPVIP